MFIWCEECGHGLWFEVREAHGMRSLLYFDDDERSATYAEHVTRCPNCGLPFVESALQATNSGGLRTPVALAEGSYIEAERRLVR